MKVKMMVVAVLIAMFAVGCSKVPAGYVGVKVYLLGSNKGVSNTEILGVGRYWIGINEELFLFPVFMQNVRWTEAKDDFSPRDEAIRFQDKNLMTITLDLGFSYTLNEKNVPDLFGKHRKGPEEITGVYLRNMIQNVVAIVGSQMEFSELNGSKKSIFIEKIESELNKKLEGEGFNISKITILGMRAPKEVADAIGRKMQAQQQAEEAKANAEATITTARAEAEAIRMRSQTITPLMVQMEAIKKWDGKLPQYMSAGSPVPFVNVK